jgi:cytochrome c-type biogenesis protein CcsB
MGEGDAVLGLILVGAGAALAVAASAWAMIAVARERRSSGAGPAALLVTALAAIAGFLVTRAVGSGSFPATDLAESLALLAFAVGVFHLVLMRREEGPGIAAFVLPVGAMLAIGSVVVAATSEPVAREFNQVFLALHATACLGAYAAFACGAAAGVAYLVQERALLTKRPWALSRRLPALSTLDGLGFRAVSFGFPLLTFGMVMGSVWASNAWQSYWLWEPKLALALVLWFLGAAIFHLRTIEHYQGRRTAYLAIAVAAMALVVFLGAGVFPGGRHAFL